MNKKEHEAGQSILIIALVVLVLLALVALVVDVGNAYAHRRMVQNAVDAAAMAGARKLAFRGSEEPLIKVTEMEILLAVKAFAEKNGLEWGAVRPYFIFNDGHREAMNKGGSYAEVPEDVIGVAVEADLPFDTYFAHLLGFPTMQATADSAAYQIWGPCSIDDCLFPVIVDISVFDETGGQALTDHEYVLWDQALEMPGSFGWIYWVDGDGNIRGDYPQGSEVTSLRPNLLDNCRSGGWMAEEWVHGDVGVNFQPVLDILEQYVTSGETVAIPIFDASQMQGNNGLYRIAGFGEFLLTCAHASRAHYVEAYEGACGPEPNKDNRKYLAGYFVAEHFAEGFEDGCIDTGVTGVSFRPPKSVWMPEWTEDGDN